MNELLEDVIAAHGGLARWKAFAKVQATIVAGGALRGMKGLVPNEHMQTSIDSIFAVGDGNGIALLDSVATPQANVAVQTILGTPTRFDKRWFPQFLHTDPPIVCLLDRGGSKGCWPTGGSPLLERFAIY